MLIMLLALFLVTMFLGTPIAFSMSFASIVTNLTHGASSLMLTAQQCYDSTSNLSLLAVPFFMLAGSIMNMGGISRRLINFCRLFVGRIRGRPGHCGCVGRHDFCSHFRLRPCYRGGFGCLYDSCYGE